MKKREPFTFNGFEQSNTTPVPDVLFDELLAELTGAELKVLLYIIRRTRGFKKDSDAISLSQFKDGIITKDHKVLDKGCGIKDRQTIINALASLESMGCIESEKSKTSSGDKATTVYHIRFVQAQKVVGKPNHPDEKVVGKPNHRSRKTQPPVVGNSNHRGRETQPPVVGNSNLQETDSQLNSLQETDSQETVRQEGIEQLSTHLEDLSAASADAPPPLSPGKEISSVEKETPATLFPEESLEEKEESKQASYSLPDVISVAPSPSSPKTPATSGSGKKGRSSRKEKLATLETFDLEQEVTVDAIMQYFDLWRGGPLAPSKRADSNYQKALMEGAIPLFQRPRANGRKGYSLQEIDRVTRFIKRIAPSEKPWLIGKDWWKGKSTEIWVVARNMDMILIEIEKLEKAHQQEMAKKSVSVPDQDKMVWFTRFDHDGDPESHWFLYEKGPESEAAKCEDSFVPAPSVQWNISLKYQSFKRGEIELPTDIPPDAPAMQLIAVA